MLAIKNVWQLFLGGAPYVSWSSHPRCQSTSTKLALTNQITCVRSKSKKTSGEHMKFQLFLSPPFLAVVKQNSLGWWQSHSTLPPAALKGPVFSAQNSRLFQQRILWPQLSKDLVACSSDPTSNNIRSVYLSMARNLIRLWILLILCQ